MPANWQSSNLLRLISAANIQTFIENFKDLLKINSAPIEESKFFIIYSVIHNILYTLCLIENAEHALAYALIYT